VSSYAFKTVLAVDYFFSVVLFGDFNVTISSRTGLLLRTANPPDWARLLGGALDKIQTNHCELAIAHDIQRSKDAITFLSGS
jgi:hypothetical protein